jgi:hypothetical protein
MPVELQIIRASEFVRIGPENHLDMEESRKALVLIAKACRLRGLDQALLDLRQLPIPDKPLFTPTELAELVDTFKQAGFGKNQRLAILYRSDPHHGARMFAFISKMRGCQVKAFQDFEQAMTWLSEMKKDAPESGIAVPISKPKAAAKPRAAGPVHVRRA